jgi:hypothetical protein
VADKRKYSRRQKLAVVMAAEVSGLTVAAESAGIPKSTVKYWLDQPEFAQFRTKAREEMADEVKVVAHLAWKRVAEALISGEMEPRDALFAADKASSLNLLMRGEATHRSESRTWTDDLNDDEKRRLRDWIDNLDTASTEGSSQTPAAEG